MASHSTNHEDDEPQHSDGFPGCCLNSGIDAFLLLATPALLAALLGVVPAHVALAFCYMPLFVFLLVMVIRQRRKGTLPQTPSLLVVVISITLLYTILVVFVYGDALRGSNRDQANLLYLIGAGSFAIFITVAFLWSKLAKRN